MPYTYAEHISDIGIEATGDTLEEAFEAGVEAMLGVMFDLSTVDERLSFQIAAGARDVELLFVEVLNETLSVQGVNELALRSLRVGGIKTEGGVLTLTGTVCGERFDAEKHAVRTEVKGATYSGLSYNKGEGGIHILKCVLDV